MTNILKYQILNIFILCIISFNIYSQDNSLIVSNIGEQEIIINSKTEVFFSTLNNTKEVAYTSSNLPSFGKIVSLSKGDGKIIFEPLQTDVGEYFIKLNAVSELGSSNQIFKLVVKGIEPGAELLYVDPINGNDSNSGDFYNPLKTLQKLIEGGTGFAAGTVIYLRSGNHGALIFSKSNSEMINIVAERGQDPLAERLSFPYASNWTVSGLKVSPEAASTTYKGVYVKLGGGARDIVVKNCEIYGTSDINNWPTNQHWYDFAGNGITSQGKYCQFKNNYIYNTDFPVTIQGAYNVLAHNIINNFSGDAVRGLANYGQFLYNQIKNAVVYDYLTGNHDDAFQSWTQGNPVIGILIKGNQITDISYPELPLQTEIMQGIVDFDGFVEDWVIEDNLVVIHHNHGIALYGARNCKIVNNTVIKNPFKKYQPSVNPWIRINRTKSGELSYGNLTRNNIMGSNFQDDYPGTIDHNFVTAGNASVFVNNNKWDFHLKGSTVPINSGEIKESTSIDAEGVLRNVGLPDLGCLERGGKDFDMENPDFSGDIIVDELGPTHVELSWAEANDNFGVKEYHILWEDQEMIVEDSKCLITDLYSNSYYTFKVFAIDFANNKSEVLETSLKTNNFDNDNYTVFCSSVKFDQEITSNDKKEWVYSDEMRIGGISNGTDLNGILIFKIPSLPPSKEILGASLTLNFEGKLGNPTGKIDVHGLDYKREAIIENDLFWQGNFGMDSKGFSIMNDIITGDSSPGLIESNQFASDRLLEYLNLQFEAGAHGNNYMLLRLNVDVENEQNGAYYKIVSGDSKNSFKRPILKFTLDHESGIEDIKENLVELYPNPVNSELYLKNINDKCEIEILDFSGKSFRKINFNGNEKGKSISTSELKSGVFYLKITANEIVKVKKFIKI